MSGESGMPSRHHGSCERLIGVDLARAARRSEDAPSRWDAARLERAIVRYEKFLRLIAKYPERDVAPTRDIDAMWHLHMLHPRAYAEGCERLFGTVLDHDGGFGTDPDEWPLLMAVFESTARLWAEEYGEPYAEREGVGAATTCWHRCSGYCRRACKRSNAAPTADARDTTA